MKQINCQNKIDLFKNDFENLKQIVEKQQTTNSLLGAYEGIIGYMYLRGWGTEKNYKKAFRHLEKSTSLGNVFSNVDLGKMYQEGFGTKQNYFKAFYLYRLAADKGISAANYRLGIMYEKGLGVKQNTQKAEEFLKKGSFMAEKNKNR